MKKNISLLLPIFVIILLFTNGCQKTQPPVAIAPAPAISAISPSSGVAGTAVTITGTDFSTTAAGNSVKFNGVAATVTSATATTLVVTAPASGTTGPISISTGGAAVNGPAFTYTLVAAAPSITAISPVSGSAGTIVTITGTNFKTTTTDNTVKFNGLAATVQTATVTTLTVLAPTSTTGAVTLVTSAGTATGPVFTYTTGPDIYIVGQATAGRYGYWKNSVFTAMPSDCQQANCICVSGSDVYVGGFDNNSAPKYWKNGTAVSLPMTAGNTTGSVNSIVVAGSDVYAAGADINGGSHQTPKCWKNGIAMNVAFDLPGTAPNSSGTAAAMAVSASDVYLAGEISGRSGGTLTYWKNNTPVALTSLSEDTTAYARAIFLQGTDVYVTGAEDYAGNGHYWKNGTAYALNSPNSIYSIVGESVFVSNSDVYVAGEYGDIAKYWKNGTMVDLTSSPQGKNIFEAANGITLNGADIYISGIKSQGGPGTASLGGYWKNGTFIQLADCVNPRGIVVQ